MADITYKGAKVALVQGLLDGTPDIRLMLVMSGFTGESEEDAVNLADLTTIDEYDGVGYQQVDCASVAGAYDDATDIYNWTYDADEFNAGGGTVAAGSDDACYLVTYLYVDGTEANDIILQSTDAGGFPFAGASTAISITPDVDGALYLASV